MQKAMNAGVGNIIDAGLRGKARKLGGTPVEDKQFRFACRGRTTLQGLEEAIQVYQARRQEA